MKVWKCALPALVLALLAPLFAQPRPAAAVVQSCPAGWVRVLTGKGVMVCGKKNAAGTDFQTYVQWVDLSQGARIRNAYQFDGSSGSSTNTSPKFKVKTVSNWWSASIASPPSGARFSAANGSFFSYFPGQWNTELSFPFKDQGNLRTVGDNTNGWTKRIFTIDSTGTRASMRDTKSSDKNWTNVASALNNDWNAVWGYHPKPCQTTDPAEVCVNIDKDNLEPRTWVGIRDADGNGVNESVFILSTKGATQQQTLDMLAVEFKTIANVQLDGSDSAQLIVRGSSYVTNSRPVPHALVVYEAP